MTNPLWTQTDKDAGIKAIVARASDLNRGLERLAYVELVDLNSLRLLLMQAENPVVIAFAREERAPAEVEIVIYDDSIEIQE